MLNIPCILIVNSFLSYFINENKNAVWTERPRREYCQRTSPMPSQDCQLSRPCVGH